LINALYPLTIRGIQLKSTTTSFKLYSLVETAKINDQKRHLRGCAMHRQV